MNKKQKNHLAMNQAVESFLKEKESKYGDVEELKLQQTALKLKNEEIVAKDDVRENVSKGTVSEKQSAKKAIIESAVAIAGRLFAYAKKSNDLSLMEKTNITRSKLNTMRYVDLPITIKTIKELAEEKLPMLGSYGVTEEKVASLGSKLTSFKSATVNKDTKGAVKSGTYVSLNQLFTQGEDILVSIDKLMEEYKESDLEFFTGYKSARVIKDLGSKHAKEGEGKKDA